MSRPSALIPPRRPPRRRRPPLALPVLLGLVLVAVAGGAWLWLRGDGGADPATTRAAKATKHRSRPASHRRVPAAQPIRLVARNAGRLAAPVQDAASAAVSRTTAILAGGLTSQDTSRSTVVVLRAGGSRAGTPLPGALHDAAAAGLGGAVYVFGGGDGVRQLDGIVRVDGHGSRTVGRLPAGSSDSAAATLGGTAYVVGGYTGTRWLDTIVAYRPGGKAHVVGHLPQPLRYAAVTAAAGRVLIAGGSLPAGRASRDVLAFDPRTRKVRRIGRLPAPTTHAAAASVGAIGYVIGGRGDTLGTPTARIVAILPGSRGLRPAGRLTRPLSDLAAVALGPRIVVAGGRDASGTRAEVQHLVPAPVPLARTSTAGTTRTTRTKRGATTSARHTTNVYAHDTTGNFSAAARAARPLVYVPNSQSDTVDVIDPRTYRVVRHFAVGGLPQHVTPAYDMRRLYVLNDTGNSLTPINPRTGRPGSPIPVDDPYNMYFTPDGRYAIVVAERLARLDFRDPHSFRLRRSVQVPCRGVDHMDFTADGRFLLASCEFSAQMVRVNLATLRVTGTLRLPNPSAMPQDVKLSPDGRTFYVADMMSNGVWKVGAARLRLLGFLPTGRGAHGLYPSRDARFLYVTNRGEGTISVVSFRTQRIAKTWRIPGGGSPDMGNVSADGRVLWLSGRYDAAVYALSTRSGKLLARIPVGQGPHGLCVWPQPGRHSLGHTGIMR